MEKSLKDKSRGRKPGKQGAPSPKGEFGRVRILSPAVKLKKGEAEVIRKAVRNYYKRTRVLEKL